MARHIQGRHRVIGALTTATVALPLALSAAPAQALSDRTTGLPAAPATQALVVDAGPAVGGSATDTASLTVIVPAGQQRTRTVSLVDTGSRTPLTIAEKDGQSWVTATPVTGQLATDGSQSLSVTVDATGVAPGTTLTGTLLLGADSLSQEVTEIPVTALVPAYQASVDTGAVQPLTDPQGDSWTPDRVYTTGDHGYFGASTRQATMRAIVGVPAKSTAALYQTARQGMSEYRFDSLPDGVYQVELGFADLSSQQPKGRVFDVTAEGAVAVSDLDLADQVGVRTAHDRAFTVKVSDGQLNLRFLAKSGLAVVNSIRVTERPDLIG